MKKYAVFLFIFIFLIAFTLPILAADELPAAEPSPDFSLYEWASSLWEYIFPADVIADNEGLFTLFTLFSVALIVFVPLFIIFVGGVFAFGSFFRRR